MEQTNKINQQFNRNKPPWKMLPLCFHPHKSEKYLIIDSFVKSRLTGENPACSGIQCFHNYLSLLDSGFRRNDDHLVFSTFYDFVIIKN